MSDQKPDYLILTADDLDGPNLSLEERAELIADVLEKGNPSALFLRGLADMVRPSSKRDPFTFVLRHAGAGAPKGPDYRLGYEMVRLVDDEGESPDVAVMLIQDRHGKTGYSRSKCLDAMRIARKEIERVKWFEREVLQSSPE